MDNSVEMNDVLRRLKEYADTKGGPSKVYGAIGKQVSTFWNLVKRDAKPSVDTLIEISAAFPDFDLNWVLVGKKNDERVKQLEYQVNVLKDMYENAVLEKTMAGKIKESSVKGRSALLGKFKDTTFGPSSLAGGSSLMIPTVNQYTNSVNPMSWVVSTGTVCANA